MIGVDLGGPLVKVATITPSAPDEIACRLFPSDEASVRAYFTTDLPGELARLCPGAAWSATGAGSHKHAQFLASLPEEMEMAANARGVAYLLARGRARRATATPSRRSGRGCRSR
jgi:hypothetical protein